MLANGVPLKVVSEIMGHSSVNITGDIYGHVSPDQRLGDASAERRALMSVRHQNFAAATTKDLSDTRTVSSARWPSIGLHMLRHVAENPRRSGAGRR